MQVTRTFDILQRYQEHFPGKPDVFVCKTPEGWKSYSILDYVNYSTWFATGLLKMGFRPGDKIASVSSNRPEWNFLDIGIAMAGMIHVPIFTTISIREFSHILEHSGSKLLILSDKAISQKLLPVAAHIPGLRGIYTFSQADGAGCWTEIVDLGRENAAELESELQDIMSSISPDDVATLIYTSGTTGDSKGVLLTHRNLVSNFIAASAVFQLKPGYRYLSILPLCHVGGRLGNYQTQYCGTSIYYAENMNAIAANMKEVRPEGFDAVPRILEKILDNIMARGNKLAGFKRKVFFWSVRLALRYRNDTRNPLFYRLKLKLADRLVFSKWREAIGGKIQMVGCGGAALQPNVEKIFWAAGVQIINMYGLTETSPIITINGRERPGVMLGSVGRLIPGVEIKIASDGEILCKGPNVMKEYYRDPEATRAAFSEDDWFCTGDIGRIEKGGFLKVTDRKKEMIKLTNGKFVAPQPLENKLKESPFIDQAFLVGDGQKFVGAIIAPNFEMLRNEFSGGNFSRLPNSALISEREIHEFYQEIIGRFNKKLVDYQRVKKILLVDDEWSPITGELSHTLKLKRRHLYQKYDHLISSIYQNQYLSQV